MATRAIASTCVLVPPKAKPTLGRRVLQEVARTSLSDRVLVFVRHSEKERVGPDPTRLLTAKGHMAAHRFGEMLPPGRTLRVHHSPAERCHQTAEDLLEGYLHSNPEVDARIEGSDGRLASWETATVDREARQRLRKELGGQRALVRAWLDGRVPPEVMRPARAMTEQLFAWAITRAGVAPSGTIHVFVSHDFSMLAFGRFVLGMSDEIPWPSYLDGPVFTLNPEGALKGRWQRAVTTIDPGRWRA